MAHISCSTLLKSAVQKPTISRWTQKQIKLWGIWDFFVPFEPHWLYNHRFFMPKRFIIFRGGVYFYYSGAKNYIFMRLLLSGTTTSLCIVMWYNKMSVWVNLTTHLIQMWLNYHFRDCWTMFRNEGIHTKSVVFHTYQRVDLTIYWIHLTVPVPTNKKL